MIRKVEEGMTRATDTAKAIEDASADDDVCYESHSLHWGLKESA